MLAGGLVGLAGGAALRYHATCAAWCCPHQEAGFHRHNDR